MLLLAIVFFCVDVFGVIYFFSGTWLYVFLILCVLALPLYFVVAAIIITPLDSYLKSQIIRKAKEKLKKYPNLRVIAITGSYGKTTTKEILKTILSEKYNVLATE